MADGTKTCPFCHEEIKAEEIKCRYCHSMLLPNTGTDRGERVHEGENVTYVLDRGLIRFVKFAAAILALFAIFGLYVFGYNLERTVDRMRDAERDLDTASSQLAQTGTALEKAQESLKESKALLKEANNTASRLKQDIDALMAEAQQIVSRIRGHEAEAGFIISSLKVLSDEEEVRLAEVRFELRDKVEATPEQPARPELHGKLWRPGIELRVRFIGGDPAMHARVADLANEWTKYANIRFRFGSNDEDAEIRISFNESQGAWSYLGTDALALPHSQATMNLGWNQASAPAREIKRAVLSLFGQMLGLISEHQNPKADIAWNEEAIYETYKYWPRDQVHRMYLHKYPSNLFADYRDFDPKSIMMFPIPNELTIGDSEFAMNYSLSEGDKELISKLYPHEL